jgi:hypothetical protein
VKDITQEILVAVFCSADGIGCTGSNTEFVVA